MNVYYDKFMTYFEIHRLDREGFSARQISEHLVLDRRTVRKLLSMSEQDYELMLEQQSQRQKTLSPYEDFVRQRLELYRDTPSAQMHDWLKEHFEDLPKVTPKTVFNFVSWVRNRHNLPFVKAPRQYEMTEELPYGKQGQVDFGEYNMRNTLGKRAKVFFFTLVLSRSRFKYVWFTDRYFTAHLAIRAHENAFGYIGGIPAELVYDQDKVFVVSENGGDIILTDAFRAYTREQSFSLHFCRKADPESKGKVENVVKYVKQNFLYNRTFHNIETLNDEVLGWMGRTANHLPHGVTRKPPYSELIKERPYLTPYLPFTAQSVSLSTYAVRKDNTVSFKGNFFSLPLGTFKGKETHVAVQIQGGELVISSPGDLSEICRHALPAGRGVKVINTDHKRDKTAAVQEMVSQTAELFAHRDKAIQWLEKIRDEKPRYTRDQLAIISGAVGRSDGQTVSRALDYCLEKGIYSATDFRSILELQQPVDKTEPKTARLNPLSGKVPDSANIRPEQAGMDTYSDILDPKTKNNL
jgi:transposase